MPSPRGSRGFRGGADVEGRGGGNGGSGAAPSVVIGPPHFDERVPHRCERKTRGKGNTSNRALENCAPELFENNQNRKMPGTFLQILEERSDMGRRETPPDQSDAAEERDGEDTGASDDEASEGPMAMNTFMELVRRKVATDAVNSATQRALEDGLQELEKARAESEELSRLVSQLESQHDHVNDVWADHVKRKEHIEELRNLIREETARRDQLTADKDAAEEEVEVALAEVSTMETTKRAMVQKLNATKRMHAEENSVRNQLSLEVQQREAAFMKESLAIQRQVTELQEQLRRQQKKTIHLANDNALLGANIETENQALRRITEEISLRDAKSSAEQTAFQRAQDEARHGPPKGLCAIVFTDVESSTKQWHLYPDAMAEAMITHDSIMREKIYLCGGYEVKTAGDAFMVAFHTATAALFWCLFVQEALLEARWPEQLLENSEHANVQHELLVRGEKGRLIWRGLRVRMGVHYGSVDCKPDPVTHRMDYRGGNVNRALRISDAGHGGQIIMSASTWKEAKEEIQQRMRVVVTELGEFTLPQLFTSADIVQVMPESLSGRQFKPLRVVRRVPNFKRSKAAILRRRQSEIKRKQSHVIRRNKRYRGKLGSDLTNTDAAGAGAAGAAGEGEPEADEAEIESDESDLDDERGFREYENDEWEANKEIDSQTLRRLDAIFGNLKTHVTGKQKEFVDKELGKMWNKFKALKATITRLSSEIEKRRAHGEHLDVQIEGYLAQIEELEGERQALIGLAFDKQIDLDADEKLTRFSKAEIDKSLQLRETVAQKRLRHVQLQSKLIQEDLSSLRKNASIRKKIESGASTLELLREAAAQRSHVLRGHLDIAHDEFDKIQKLVVETRKQWDDFQRRNPVSDFETTGAAKLSMTVLESQLKDKTRQITSIQKQMWISNEEVKMLRNTLDDAIIMLPIEDENEVNVRALFRRVVAQEEDKADAKLMEDTSEQLARSKRRYEAEMKNRDELLKLVQKSTNQSTREVHALALRAARMLAPMAGTNPVPASVAKRAQNDEDVPQGDHTLWSAESPSKLPMEEERALSALVEEHAVGRATEWFARKTARKQAARFAQSMEQIVLDRLDVPQIPPASVTKPIATVIATLIREIGRARAGGHVPLSETEVVNVWEMAREKMAQRQRVAKPAQVHAPEPSEASPDARVQFLAGARGLDGTEGDKDDLNPEPNFFPIPSQHRQGVEDLRHSARVELKKADTQYLMNTITAQSARRA